MEATRTDILPLTKKKVTLVIGQKCPICHEELLDVNKQLKKMVMDSKELGPVHEGCFMPYLGEERLQLLYQIRCYSIGDTIAATPALREIRRLYPKIKITVVTFFPELFIHNPHVNAILDFNKKILQSLVDSYHLRVDGFSSDRAHHFGTHSVDFSSLAALNRTLLPNEWGYELYYSPEDRDRAISVFQSHGIDIENDKVILLHPHRTEWTTRDWGPYRMPELARRIADQYPDHKIVSIGGKRQEVPDRTMPNYVALPGAIDLYGQFSLLESAAMMDFPCVKLLVTPDTGTLHLGATRPELPIVGIFTLVKAFLRTPVRNGRLSYKFIGVESESACNCTYDARYLTQEFDFTSCPKKRFFDQVDRTNLPTPAKIAALQDFEPSVDWSIDKVGRTLKKEIKKYNPTSLPCFPSVDRVMAAVDRAMEQWG